MTIYGLIEIGQVAPHGLWVRAWRSWVNRRSPCMNATVAGITPPSPCTGSSITATTDSSNARSTAARSLKGSLMNPGMWGVKSCSQPGLPEAAMVASVRP